MSRVRTKSNQSATRRDVSAGRQARAGRATRAEHAAWRVMLEYIGPSGGATKWCGVYYGGETRAGS